MYIIYALFGLKINETKPNEKYKYNNNDNNKIIRIIVQYVGDTDLFARDYYPQHATIL